MHVAMRTLMAPALALALLGSCNSEKSSEKVVKDYIGRSKQAEAMIQLNKIAKRAQEEYVTNARFPTEAAPLTPAVDCCKQNAGNKRKCAATPADWSAPAWQALDFSVDADSFFRYSYEPVAGGTGFVARAVADLDCDGTAITWEARGSAVNGTPKFEIVEPAPNTD